MKNLKNLGEILNKTAQKAIQGGSSTTCSPFAANNTPCPEGCSCYKGFCITDSPNGPGLCF